jgi:hypothetical protein
MMLKVIKLYMQAQTILNNNRLMQKISGSRAKYAKNSQTQFIKVSLLHLISPPRDGGGDIGYLDDPRRFKLT